MSMGVQALGAGNVIEIDPDHYAAEIALKHRLLREDTPYYFQALPRTEAAQWEVLELLLPQLAARYPQWFTLKVEQGRWHWHNQLLNEETEFRPGMLADLRLSPLHWLGRQLQEDLLVLDGNMETGFPLVAGLLCFPNSWCLEEKLGQSFLAIHEPVPSFARHLGRSSQLLLQRLKAGRPVWRLNWAFRSTPRLDITPRAAGEVLRSYANLSEDTVGERCWLRVERQTLTRLPETEAILFTVHTYQAPVAEIVVDPVAARKVERVLTTTPPEMLAYKGVSPFIEPLLAYLQRRCA
ncbi:heme-dependent oxidative N-demethylase family protein [Dictyobacter halimunensis]